MPKSWLLLLLSFLMAHLNIFGQNNPISDQDLILQGFSSGISGTDFWYHSAVPDIHNAYLVRALDGQQSMEWYTETVPDQHAESVVFIWLAGIGSNLGKAEMYVNVNDTRVGSFETTQEKAWDHSFPNGTTLSFRTSLTDGANDLFGFMFLRIPMNQLRVGEPVKIAVVGSPSNSQAWYMTFLEEIPTGLTMNTYPAIFTDNGEPRQPVNFQIIYFGQPTPAKIYINNKIVQEIQLQFGIQNIQIGIKPVNQPKPIKIRLASEPLSQSFSFVLQPVRKWKVGFVQHSHTDIGYTRPQHEILAEHLRFIDYALDYCDATDHYPDEAKFRWTCEASFAVDDYLRSRPKSQIDRLIQRINEERIEVTGMYFNFDEMPDEYTLAASLKPLKRFKEMGIPVTAAMQDDVNGIAWCFADYFEPLGVKYLNMGTHGHRALIAFDKPTAFWWESPSGRRMLTFRAEHYMTGNTVFGIHGDDFTYFENKFMSYLAELEEKGYPYDVIHIQHSGYQTDNAPPSTKSSEMVLQWNKKYSWPKIKTATVSEFFKELEAEEGPDLPVYRAAWPDWWTDGFASGAREAATSRAAHEDLLAFETSLAMSRILGASSPEGIQQRIHEVQQSLLFYDEHTFGHAQSVREPFGEGTMEQRELKESYAWEAYRRARRVGEEAMGLLQEFIVQEDQSIVAVFNTLNYQRTDVLDLYIDHQIIPMGAQFELIDDLGTAHPAQALNHRSDGTYWSILVKDIPAFSMKKLRVNLFKSSRQDAQHFPEPYKLKKSDTQISFENKYYQAIIDTGTASVTSLIDKSLNQELVDQNDSLALASLVYERLGNREQMEAFTLNDYSRVLLDSIHLESTEEGPIWTTIRFKAESEACIGPGGAAIEIRFFHDEKRIDFHFNLRKKSIIEPEAIYIAFPFNLPDGQIFFDVPGGSVHAGVNQIPGSTTDWNTIQNYAAIKNQSAQIVLSSSEIPLMQLGGINTGRYQVQAKPEKTHLYGWPMNNYWTTNFNADQRGEFSFSYKLTSSSNTSNVTASQFGWKTRIPLLGRTLPPGNNNTDRTLNADQPLIEGIPANIQLISARILSDPSEILLHLREVNNEDSLLNISIPHRRNIEIKETNVLGEVLTEGVVSEIKALESKFIKIRWK